MESYRGSPVAPKKRPEVKRVMPRGVVPMREVWVGKFERSLKKRLLKGA